MSFEIKKLYYHRTTKKKNSNVIIVIIEPLYFYIKPPSIFHIHSYIDYTFFLPYREVKEKRK